METKVTPFPGLGLGWSRGWVSRSVWNLRRKMEWGTKQDLMLNGFLLLLHIILALAYYWCYEGSYILYGLGRIY